MTTWWDLCHACSMLAESPARGDSKKRGLVALECGEGRTLGRAMMPIGVDSASTRARSDIGCSAIARELSAKYHAIICTD